MTAGQELIDPRKVNEEARYFGVKKFDSTTISKRQ